jgi:hypothetical protein
MRSDPGANEQPDGQKLSPVMQLALNPETSCITGPPERSGVAGGPASDGERGSGGAKPPGLRKEPR